MTNVVVLGHGGYGTATERNLNMLVGAPEAFRFIDFDEQDDLTVLQQKIAAVLSGLEENAQVLFACDLTGGSPFREAAALCLLHEGWVTVAGLNTAAYAEMTFNLDLCPLELAEMAMETAKQAIMVFPQKE
ncbi:MAG: hypothetical protein ABFC62_02170 [Clostridiaceae bacterium]|nr:hypothetical protein [Eubacteriales bacterium]